MGRYITVDIEVYVDDVLETAKDEELERELETRRKSGDPTDAALLERIHQHYRAAGCQCAALREYLYRRTGRIL